MKVGFTGTRNGLTAKQSATFARLAATDWAEFHHGDCIGADAEAVTIVAVLNPSCVIHQHPPTNPHLRAHTERQHRQVVHPAKPYMARNADIVAAADHLYACPAEMVAQVRGGTWRTINHALATGMPVTIIFPDGTTRQPGQRTPR